MPDIQITLTISTDNTQRVLDSFNALAGKTIEINANELEGGGHWSFRYDPKDVGETNQDYTKRVLKELVKAVIRAVDFAEDYQRYSIEVAAITPPGQDVPEDIIK